MCIFWGRSQGFCFLFAYGCPIILALFVERLFIPDWIASTPLGISWPWMCGSVNGLSSIPLICLSVFTLVPDCLDYNILVFFFSKFVGYSRAYVWLHTHFIINLSISLKEPARIFNGIALKLYRSVWARNLTLLLTLPIHLFGISLH